MKRDKWLAALLIASWTLNVALVVAYVFRQTLPVGAFRIPRSSEDAFAPQPPPPLARAFREDVKPLFTGRHDLMRRMADAYSADNLDTARFTRLADSLRGVRDEMHRRMTEHLILMHGELEPDQRGMLFGRAMHDFERGKRHPHPRSRRDAP